jgi:hypothetical protein
MSMFDYGAPMITLTLDDRQLSDPEVADAFRTLMAALQGARERHEQRTMKMLSEHGHGDMLGLGQSFLRGVPPKKPPG